MGTTGHQSQGTDGEDTSGEPPSFGWVLRDLRLLRGISLRALSQQTYYSKSYLSRVENGHRAPSAPLARRLDEVLRADGRLAACAAAEPPRLRRRWSPEAVRPVELPADVLDFTGREAQLAQLDRVLAQGLRSTAVTLLTISGPPGIGKTALALHWAHRVADQFPDGVLYANLRGDEPGRPSIPVAQVADRFLRTLGASPGTIPADPDGGSALLRTLSHGKKILFLLDSVASAAQVWPVLPGSPGCSVAVTSRHRLAELAIRNGARCITLAPLSPAESMLLLERLLGPARVAAEPGPATEIARLCRWLPLELRIAADRAVPQPRLSLSALAAQLAADRASSYAAVQWLGHDRNPWRPVP